VLSGGGWAVRASGSTYAVKCAPIEARTGHHAIRATKPRREAVVHRNDEAPPRSECSHVAKPIVEQLRVAVGRHRDGDRPP